MLETKILIAILTKLESILEIKKIIGFQISLYY